MKIRFTIWIWYCRFVSCLAIPFVIFDFWEPDWWSRTDSTIFWAAAIVFAGLPGALVAVLVKTGKIGFVYSVKDERRIEYKLLTFFGRSKMNQ
jgi:hypothetical protein